MKAESADRDALQDKRELQAFLGIINYLSKFSPGTEDVCEAPKKNDISQNWVDLEWKYRKYSIRQSQS